jgi:hypothetical protein
MSVDNDNSSSDDFNATISNEPEVGDIGYIDNATLLQVDVTAIVGIFIFLTLKQLSHDQSDRMGALLLWRLTFAAVLPFAISALFILYDAFYPYPEDWGPKVFAMIGFAYILVIFGIIFLYQWIQARKTT